jgi:hypothetical protein
MRGSSVARRALQGTSDTGQPTEEDRMVGVDRRTPLVRKPSGQTMHIHPNGRLTAATIAARRRLVAAVSPARGRGDASWHESL